MKTIFHHAIMHTPFLGYYWRTQETYNSFDPNGWDWIIQGYMDQQTAEDLVRICTEQGVDAARAAWRLLQ